ncbi:MAG: hypothetical protein H6Q90_801 [Deltaproteobacteria bacterium]|nr:hypothetical protein [Deltaproteobacteria bacterium]
MKPTQAAWLVFLVSIGPGVARADDGIQVGDGVLFDGSIDISRRDPSIKGDAPRSGLFVRSSEGFATSGGSSTPGQLALDGFGSLTVGFARSPFQFVELASQLDAWHVLAVPVTLDGATAAISPEASGRHRLTAHAPLASVRRLTIDGDVDGRLVYSAAEGRGLRSLDVGPSRFRDLSLQARLWFRDGAPIHEHVAVPVAYSVRQVSYSGDPMIDSVVSHRLATGGGIREYERDSRFSNDFVSVAWQHQTFRRPGEQPRSEQQLDLKLLDLHGSMRGYEGNGGSVHASLDFFVGWSWMFAAPDKAADDLFTFSVAGAIEDHFGRIGGRVAREPAHTPDGRDRLSQLSLEAFAAWAPDGGRGGVTWEGAVARFGARDQPAMQARHALRSSIEVFGRILGGHLGVFGRAGTGTLTGGAPWSEWSDTSTDAAPALYELGLFARWRS